MGLPRTFHLLFIAVLAASGCSDGTTESGSHSPDAAIEASVDGGVESGADAATDSGADAPEAQPYSCPTELVFTVQTATVDDLNEELTAGADIEVVDVREPVETAAGIIEGALLYPWSSGVLEAGHDDLPADKPLYVICQSGSRSMPASSFLVANGHPCVFNVQGGMVAWEAAGYPTVVP